MLVVDHLSSCNKPALISERFSNDEAIGRATGAMVRNEDFSLTWRTIDPPIFSVKKKRFKNECFLMLLYDEWKPTR